MKAYELIRILANVCKYNPEGEIIIQLSDGTQLPAQACVMDTMYNGRQACAIIPNKSK